MTAYAALQVTSNFSFLEAASHPEELVAQAAALGLHAMGIADINSLAGVVRAHVAAKEVGLRFGRRRPSRFRGCAHPCSPSPRTGPPMARLPN